MKLSPVVIIDTREQDPWTFANLPTEPGTLPCSPDYTRDSENASRRQRRDC